MSESGETAPGGAAARTDAAGEGGAAADGSVAAGHDLLRRSALFADLPDEDLARLWAGARPVAVAPGELLMEEGSPGDALYVVLEGDFEVFKGAGADTVPIATVGPGGVLGEMALLERGTRTASVRAVSGARVLRIDEAVVDELIRTRPSAALAVVRTATARLRATEAMLQQREKLAALGTMAAGLAHELNNPAAAARRSADLLHEALDRWERAAGALAELPADAAREALVEELRGELGTRSAAREALDPLALSDRESALQKALEARGVDEAWELAGPIAALGWDAAALEALAVRCPGDAAFAALARWLGAGAGVHLLLAEVGTSVGRISEIVKAVKTYAYLDQAPIQEVDVHEGLENTLVILRHKLKQGIGVTRRYAVDLPRIEAYASELNQVWTNILDNAADAMGGQGELTIATRAAEGAVVVELCDDGPGIPPELQKRIFEPFFTTKPPGVGTGLGMHIVYNIVQRHHGRIGLRSRPGETCFEVTLPLRLARS